jgi:XTP/dITP diphosphohydrolase
MMGIVAGSIIPDLFVNHAPLHPASDPLPAERLLVVATTNRHKTDEISRFLSGLVLPGNGRLRVASAAVLPPGEAPEESGATFAENARLKALACAGRAMRLPPGARPAWVLADDSGLSVDALGGEPGVRSARYAGPGATDAMNKRKLLEALRGVPRGARGAEFACALAVVDLEAGEAGRVAFTAEGRCRGEILLEEQGAGGFGYDPLFLVPGVGRTFAQLPEEEKNRVSHRGRALRALRERLAGGVAAP